MDLQKLTVIKSDPRGIMYDCGKLKFIVRIQGSISANHIHEAPEILYLMSGDVELTVGEEVKKVSAPMRIGIPGKIYHKLVALSDIEILEDREEYS